MASKRAPVVLSGAFRHLRFLVTKKQTHQNAIAQDIFVRRMSSKSKHSDLFHNTMVQNYLEYIENVKDSNKPRKGNVHLLCGLLEKQSKLNEDLKKLCNMNSEGDVELQKMIDEEKITFEQELENLQAEIVENILPHDEDEGEDGSQTEIQIIPGIGGDEAKLFAEELYAMYLNYIQYKGYDCLLTELRGSRGDISSAYILLSGRVPYKSFINECGVHRVQRVPVTEKSGRVHTSTCSVFVYNKPCMKDIHIHPNDLICEAVRSSGPGGQNVNKTESCIQLTHKPTGIKVECQTSRYQYDNKKFALQKLKSILWDMEQKKINDDKKSNKKEQVGTNDYSDKIRTYNFNQNRVTDHRISYSMHNLTGLLMGGKELDHLIAAVDESKRSDSILNYVKNILKSDDYKSFKKDHVQVK